jgi:hypothetical protein
MFFAFASTLEADSAIKITRYCPLSFKYLMNQ